MIAPPCYRHISASPVRSNNHAAELPQLVTVLRGVYFNPIKEVTRRIKKPGRDLTLSIAKSTTLGFVENMIAATDVAKNIPKKANTVMAIMLRK